MGSETQAFHVTAAGVRGGNLVGEAFGRGEKERTSMSEANEPTNDELRRIARLTRSAKTAKKARKK